MRVLLLTSAAFLTYATASYSGTLDAPVIPVAPVVTSAETDWNGFYIGGVASAAEGQQTYVFDGGGGNGPWPHSGTQYGGFAGYNFQNGAMVYGAEISYQVGQLIAPVFNNVHGVQDMLDVKGRVGYVSGNALFYGSVGWSSGTFNETTGASEVIPAQGINYGFGADVMVTDT
ncbi:MAG: porin family protein, partial [Rhodobacteraceae bacterium]|nr:porin family protein [Paracoccaceae bacterium]